MAPTALKPRGAPREPPPQGPPLPLAERPRAVARLARATQERGPAMSIIAWVCAPLALLGAGVLLILRPWVDQGERKQRQRRAAHLDGWHEACALTQAMMLIAG